MDNGSISPFFAIMVDSGNKDDEIQEWWEPLARPNSDERMLFSTLKAAKKMLASTLLTVPESEHHRYIIAKVEIKWTRIHCITDRRYTCGGSGWVRVDDDREKCAGCLDCEKESLTTLP